MVQSWQYEEPQYWDTYVPQPEDYATTAEWQAALLAGSQDTSPKIGEYWDPIGQVWRGGKTTEQEQALVKFGKRDKSYDAGMGGAALRLNSSIGVNPDEARAAYMAYDEFGNPRIDPAVQALIEQQMGIGPYEPPPTTNMGGGTDPRTGGRPVEPTQTDAQRWGDWWNSGDDGAEAPGRPGGTGGQGVSVGLQPGDPSAPTGPSAYIWDEMTRTWVPNPQIGQSAGPNTPAGVVAGPVATPGGRADSPTTPLPPGMVNESNAATIDPRYPDWLMQYTQRLGGRRNNKWGPMPNGGLGQY
jgi:hypothetical protein